ncbi:hypothetical protein DZC73_17570 [Albitalea terrae]|uniref:DUF8198 domain-containing protein n=1 Tax=Piscinibacter terrae TaxID=2496871 RepID=A0A3N7HQ99_9BURK|nr:hypothetical protein DZC73_17570 [Albitalea terrae]
MNSDAQTILGHLETVGEERARRDRDPGLDARVIALKTYQQRRFAKTYADLLPTDRYGPASRFFIEELYGPRDFADRDAQFARVVPALVRLFPREIIATVSALAQLHALSEQLDTETATHLESADALNAFTYTRAWQAAGRRDDREKQIELTLQVGRSLDRLTRNPLLRHSLRMMRGPAKGAGLSDLQRFLETGFDNFKTMHGANEFLGTIEARERRLARDLFEAPLYPEGRLGDTASGQLP